MKWMLFADDIALIIGDEKEIDALQAAVDAGEQVLPIKDVHVYSLAMSSEAMERFYSDGCKLARMK